MWVIPILIALVGLTMLVLTTYMPVFNGVFPDWSIVPQLLNYGFYFIPLSTFLVCFSLIMLFQQFNLIFAITNWLIRKIPTIG